MEQLVYPNPAAYRDQLIANDVRVSEQEGGIYAADDESHKEKV